MHVRDVMTENVHTVCVDTKTIVASEIMDWAKVRHVPVIDGERRVVGIITHRDLLRVSISALSTSVAKIEKRQHLSMVPISEVLRSDVRTISPDASVRLAARIMREEKFGCLPVVEKGKLVGVVTEADLLQLVEMLPDSAVQQTA